MYELENVLRPYAWGSPTAIADLLGRPASGGPEAELWIGAHPDSPSVALTPAAGGAGPAHARSARRRTARAGRTDRRGSGALPGRRERGRIRSAAAVPAQGPRGRDAPVPAGAPDARPGPGRLRARGSRRRRPRRPGPQLQGRLPQAGNDLRADPVRGALRFPAGGRIAGGVPSIWRRASTSPGWSSRRLFRSCSRTWRSRTSPRPSAPPLNGSSPAARTSRDATAVIVAALVSGAPMAAHVAELTTVVNLNDRLPRRPGRADFAAAEPDLAGAGSRPCTCRPETSMPTCTASGSRSWRPRTTCSAAGSRPKFVDVPELLKTVAFEAVDVPMLPAETTMLGQELFRPPFREFQLQRIELAPGAEPVPLAQSGAAVVIVTGRLRPPRLPEGRAAAGTGRQRLPARRRGPGQRPSPSPAPPAPPWHLPSPPHWRPDTMDYFLQSPSVGTVPACAGAHGPRTDRPRLAFPCDRGIQPGRQTPVLPLRSGRRIAGRRSTPRWRP